MDQTPADHRMLIFSTDDRLWDSVIEAASRRGISVAELVNQALKRHLPNPRSDAPAAVGPAYRIERPASRARAVRTCREVLARLGYHSAWLGRTKQELVSTCLWQLLREDGDL